MDAGADDRIGVIDYWCNLFTPEVGEAWRKVISKEVPWDMEDLISYAFVEPEEFIKRLDAAGVERVLIPATQIALGGYVGTPFSGASDREELTGKLERSVQRVAELADEHPGRFHGMCGINPNLRMDGVRVLEEAVRDHGFVGAHLHPYGWDRPLDDRDYYPFYAKCAELEVPVVMQAGHSAEIMPSAHGKPITIDLPAIYFPQTKFVLAHTGWPWVEEAIAMAWKHPNVYLGTSAHRPKYWDRSLIHFINTRGKRKVLFGTDYPVVMHEQALEEIDKLNLRPEPKRGFLHDNAAEVFGFAE